MRAGRAAGTLLTWLAIPCFVLALFTKQTALAGPLAAGAYLLVRDWRRGLAWSLGLGLAGGIPFLALDLTSGHWFYLKMIDYHSLPWSPSTFGRLLGAWQEDHLLLIAAAVGYGVWRLLQRQNDLIAWYLGATLALLPTAGVVGADHNHLLPVDLALALAAGAGLAAAAMGGLPAGQLGIGGWGFAQRAVGGGIGAAAPISTGRAGTQAGGPARYARVALVGLLLACIGYLAMVATPADWFAADIRQPDAAEQTQLHKIVEFLRQAQPGRYFAGDPGLLALAGKATDYDDPFTMTALAATGRWDARLFEDALRRAAFPYVLLAGDVSEPPHVPLRADILTASMRAALLQGYRVLFPDVYFTYGPRR